jgi:hypothetical protein
MFKEIQSDIIENHSDLDSCLMLRRIEENKKG